MARTFTAKSREEADIARRNWARYEYGKQRGHAEYCEHALRLEGMYVGGGRQWDEADREQLEEEGRKPFELNEIFDAINTALGHQIQNRVDISYRPRSGGADDKTAETLSKVGMQIADNNDYRHRESQVAADGFIQQRGYFEIRVDYSDSLMGEIRIDTLDPLDVIPDPDGKDYDPDTWQDVIITRWMSLEDIEVMYGAKARRKIEMSPIFEEGDEDFGESEIDGIRRNKFGHETDLHPDYSDEGWSRDVTMIRVIDRQHWKMEPTEVVLYPSGDIRIIEDATEAQRQAALRAGGMMFRRPMKRVRWTVSTYGEVLLHDKWSPYKHFTVVPFFPFFRRGITRGLVDNAIGAQEMLNKALSQYIHILNSVANSGWLVEQNSLTNMSTDDLEEQGAATGLVLEYKRGTNPPEKIKPNEVPQGVDRLIELGSQKIRTITGITDAFRGQAQSANQSGKAIQSLQFGSQLSLAVPLDNLARTRHLLASRMLELIQGFMDAPQIMRITDRKPGEEDSTEELRLNWELETGEIINNLTIGEYDVIVTDQPNHITFEHSQYEQALQMKKEGAPIPWSYIVRYSPLAERNELSRMVAEQEGQQTDPEKEAKAVLAKAQAALAEANAVNKSMEAFFSAMRSSQLLRSDPALASLADQMLRSGGYVDKDAPPIVPDASGLPPAAPPPTNTNPLTPDNPAVGVNDGIETQPA